MRIAYLAKHDSGDNDDEGAIAHALRVLGHEVECIHEKRTHRPAGFDCRKVKADFLLFHKCPTPSTISEFDMPRAFWYFDMVRSIEDDPTLKARSLTRIQWMRDVIPLCVTGFCTDGDWALENGLVHLMQGADERTACILPHEPEGPPLLFTGMINHGQRRAQHIAELREAYGDKFEVLGDGGPRHRLHGRALAEKFAQCKIVIAPDGPNTDRYWSNRVYLTTGLGGFILHPHCDGLAAQYDDGTDAHLDMYRTRAELLDTIHLYLNRAKRHRECARRDTHEYTMKHHTYRHRCEELVNVMRSKL